MSDATLDLGDLATALDGQGGEPVQPAAASGFGDGGAKVATSSGSPMDQPAMTVPSGRPGYAPTVQAPVAPGAANIATPVAAPTTSGQPAQGSVAGSVTPAGNQTNQPVDTNAKMAEVLKQVRKFGGDEGRGINARPSFYLTLTEAAAAGAITPDDANVLFDTYSKGTASAKGLAWVKQSSAAQQTSKVGTMIKLGCLTNVSGPDLNTRVGNAIRDHQNETGKPPKKSAVDCLLTAARMQLNQPDTPLTDEQVKQALDTPAAEQKILVDLLGQVLDKADAIHTSETNPPDEETARTLEVVMSTLSARIGEMGGTTAQRKAIAAAAEKKRKADEKAAKAQAAAAKAAAEAGAAQPTVQSLLANYGKHGKR